MWREPEAVTGIRAGDRQWGVEVEEPGLAQTMPEALAVPVPELAFFLVAVGLLAVMAWLATPGGAGSGGAIGAVLLLVGGTGLAAVPITLAGLILLVIAAASLWFEVRYLPGVGLHAIGGWLALTLGGLFLHGEWSGAHPAVVLPTATLTAAGTYLAGRRYWQHIDNDPFARSLFLTDRHTVVLHAEGLRGQAVVGGQLWAIRSRGVLLHPGQHVWIVDAQEGWLTVEPDPAGDSDEDR
jgi:membrane-bound ClpP family serine protease